MRNRLFYVQNAGHTMRNAVLYFYFSLCYIVDLQKIIVHVMRI